jgi:MYXO-CTERM domain-containing protein
MAPTLLQPRLAAAFLPKGGHEEENPMNFHVSRLKLSVGILASGLLGSGVAAAIGASPEPQSSCGADTDCEKGFVCAVVGGVACAAPPCAEGEACEIPTCEPMEIRACVPAQCSSNADCAADMLCLQQTTGGCSVPMAPPCEPGLPCPDSPAVPECSEVQVSGQCVPRYQLPCQTAEDCGDGFNCVAAQSCSCPGSEGTSPSDAAPEFAGSPGGSSGDTDSPAPPKVPEDCSCFTDESYKLCEPKDIACATDDACPESWSCQMVGGYSACSGGTPDSSDDPAEGVDRPMCVEVTGELKCVPPYYYGGPVAPGGVPAEGGTGRPVVGVPDGVLGSPGAVPPSGPAAPQDPNGSSATGNPAAPNGRGGCQVSASPMPAGGGLVLGSLLGLLAAAFRRRRTAG